MPRQLLDESRIHPTIREKVANNRAAIVQEVQEAIAKHPVVVVGMAMNVFPKRALAALRTGGIDAKYLEYGSYFSDWRRRTALKMWTGWPTFPMVFVKGILIGGASETKALVESGDLQRMIAS